MVRPLSLLATTRIRVIMCLQGLKLRVPLLLHMEFITTEISLSHWGLPLPLISLLINDLILDSIIPLV